MDNVEDRAPDAGLDVWALAGMPGTLPVATYLTVTHAAQYRLIVDVLIDQQQHSLTGVARTDLTGLIETRLAAMVSPDDVARLLEPDTFDLDHRLNQLRAWGVVEAWQDRAVADADFLRNRDRYQLTSLAAQIHRAVRALDQDSIAEAAATLAPLVLAAQP